MIYDGVVIGGGPAGATAAEELACSNKKVALIDKPGRIKPCGGAVPPILIRDFKIPDEQVVAKIKIELYNFIQNILNVFKKFLTIRSKLLSILVI